MLLLRAWWGEVRAAVVVFCWRQPFASHTFTQGLAVPVPGRRGVLLVHGFACNRGLWNPWLRRLEALGIPAMAVNMEPVFGSIDSYISCIEDAVCELERSTGQAPIVVARSMGGLAVRRWWAECGDATRVHRLMTLGTPHQGTWLARFALTRNARQMKQGSAWLSTLVAREAPDRCTQVTCFFSHCDNIVFPPRCAVMPGAAEVHLPGVAHVQMVDHAEPWLELQRWLSGQCPNARQLPR